jgi:hypothetical protein
MMVSMNREMIGVDGSKDGEIGKKEGRNRKKRRKRLVLREKKRNIHTS